MAAIDSKHLVEILAVNRESGTSKKTGNAWEMFKAQCIITSDNRTKIGELIMPKHLVDTTPGKYLVEFELDVSFDRVVVPRIIALHPHGAANSPVRGTPLKEPQPKAA